MLIYRLNFINSIMHSRLKIVYATICLATVCINLLEGIGIGLLIPMLEVLGKGADLAGHNYPIREILIFFKNIGIPPTTLSFLIIISILLSLRYTLSLILAWFIDVTLHKTTKALRDKMFDNLMDVGVEFYHTTRVGELANSLGQEALKGTFVIRGLINLVSTIILALCYTGVLLVFSHIAMLAVLVALIISFFATRRIIARTNSLGSEKNKFDGAINAFCVEAITNIMLIKGFVLEGRVKDMFHKITYNVKKTWQGLSFNRRLLEYLGNILQLASVSCLIFFLVEVFHLSIAYTVGTLIILSRLLPFITQISGYINEIYENLPALENIHRLGMREDKPYIKSGGCKVSGLKQGIEFRNVSFAYQKDKKIFDSLNLTIHKGETVGIVGASGAGKSTLIYLIPRFYDTSSGEILIDGVNIKDLDINLWRNKIGLVAQETFILNDTVRNNLLIVKPDASDDEIDNALRASYLEEFIKDIRRGLDTIVGDRGLRLSGGQRQRLAIARIFLKNPELLIMDEATNSLDNVSERLIWQSIEKLRKDRTVIIVAHRLSTVNNADRIVVIEQGRIMEEGRPQELLEKKGQYYSYHRYS